MNWRWVNYSAVPSALPWLNGLHTGTNHNSVFHVRENDGFTLPGVIVLMCKRALVPVRGSRS